MAIGEERFLVDQYFEPPSMVESRGQLVSETNSFAIGVRNDGRHAKFDEEVTFEPVLGTNNA